jgi:dephospho-CoA kinase
MPIEEKRTLANHVIDNSGSRDATRDQVRKVWKELQRGGHADLPTFS